MHTRAISSVRAAGSLSASAGTLRLLRYLRAPWRWVRVLGLIPRPILDVLYRALAKNRYAIFGKADRCTLDERVIARTL